MAEPVTRAPFDARIRGRPHVRQIAMMKGPRSPETRVTRAPSSSVLQVARAPDLQRSNRLLLLRKLKQQSPVLLRVLVAENP